MLLQPQQDGPRGVCVVVVVSLGQSRKIANFENRALGVSIRMLPLSFTTRTHPSAREYGYPIDEV